VRYTPALLQKKPFVFPEARWFHDSFYFCDIDAGTLYRIGADGTRPVHLRPRQSVSGWVRLDDGSLLSLPASSVESFRCAMAWQRLR